MIDIIINGEKREIESKTTLLELVKNLEIEDRVVAAALNSEVAKKEQWGECELKSGDRVELLNFVGGGSI